MSEVEYDPSSNSNSSFHVRVDIFHLLLLLDFFIVYASICHV